MKLTKVVLAREGNRAGFIVAADTLDEFARKVEPLAAVVVDATWKAYPLPDGTDPALASRGAL